MELHSLQVFLTIASEKKADGTTERVPLLLVRPESVTKKLPVVISLHGTGGNKEGATFSLLPYMEMGWNVVNVEYRLAKISLAPAYRWPRFRRL